MKLKKRNTPVSGAAGESPAEETGGGVEEYALAAFLTGKLEAHSRKRLASCLADDEDARELLHMASEALRAAAA